jgi:hypothetical protein
MNGPVVIGISLLAIGSGGSSRKPIKSSVVGGPIVLALEDADGSPSFLEKALTFIENHGTSAPLLEPQNKWN